MNFHGLVPAYLKGKQDAPPVSEQEVTETPKKPERREEKLPIYLSQEEFIKLMKYVKREHYKLAFNLGFSSGLRISEIINLKPESVDFGGKRIFIRNSKYNKDRVVPLPKGFPERYLSLLPIKCGKRALEIAFKLYTKKAGIKKEGLHFHSLRHGFAVACMEKGIPLNQVQALLGHRDLHTTNIYTKINPQDALNSYEKLW